ncbi:uncharacterized protein LOC118743780 [Rhagoletis pomonella]|uniref:uncharacterized protein LOC118743780 n=1 Tax=Rhagoletis pomonella TaxID=28610 RepID=UPI001782C03E|nr:uncharacterized protein LOC118743780 [Rhagoletis pomonella]
MVACLGNYRHIRILFIWNTEYTTESSSEKRHDLQHQQQLLFEYCAQMHLLNVISIYRDHAVDGHFYTFSYFPQFYIQRKTLEDNCFPDRIRNMRGTAIRIVPDQFHPWTFVWHDRDGTLQIDGYLIKILREFAKRNNSTLTLPVPVEPDVSKSGTVWSGLLQNNTVDIIVGIASPDSRRTGVELSTTLQPVDWIFMLPMPPLVPDGEVLWFILNSMLGLSMLLLLFLFSIVLTFESVLQQRRSLKSIVQLFIWMLTNVVLRCIIGQSSYLQISAITRKIKRFMYFFLFLSGIFVSTFLSAGLQSYSTSKPSKYPLVRTFEDLAQIQIAIKVSQMESEIIPLYIGTKSTKMLRLIIEPSIYKVQNERTSMKGNYAYVILSPLLPVLLRLQSYLPRPLYYVREGVYVSKSIPMSIPMQMHSIYREALNKLIHQIQSAGLAELWKSQCYDDMIAAKILNTTKIMPAKQNPMGLNDFFWLWWLYGIGMSVAICVFCAELWHKNRAAKKVIVKQQR